jgi:hypothetical protein
MAQEDPARYLHDLINHVRLGEGLAPLGGSNLLYQAAQRHADDLVAIGKVTHEGSDSSTYQQRIREARYHAWEDGLMVDEVLWAGLGAAEDALRWFYSNPEWAVLTDPRYREIGIGYAEDNGVRYFVVDLGARPGVLPVFANDGAAVTDAPSVALRLTNEEAVPLGDGTWMGRAIEVRLSNEPDFEGIAWQPWEPLLPWLLAGTEPDSYAVYVQFRDGANRTAVAEDTIQLVAQGEVPPTPTPLLDLGTPLDLPDGGTGTPTDAPADATGDAPSSPEPVASPTASSVVVATATALPDAGGLSSEQLSAYPTWTPLPPESPSPLAPAQTDWPVILAVGLQIAALLLGAAAFLRRR